jgi:hypothetical protein
MRIQTILNQVEKFKSFVYGEASLEKRADGLALVVQRCGVTVEMVPWCDGKNHLSTTYRWFLATWAKRLSWSEAGAIFRTSWDSVCRAVEHAVEWSLAHRDMSGLTALGVDEIAWARGHTYRTLFYTISAISPSRIAPTDSAEEAGFPNGSARYWIQHGQ